MAYNVRNENYSNYSNYQLDNRSRQEHLRTQRHINTGHGMREQACNGMHRLWIKVKAILASVIYVGVIAFGVMVATGSVVVYIGGPCNEMRFEQWYSDKPVNWGREDIKTWNTKCRGAMPSSPGNGGTYWLWTLMGLTALCAWSVERELLEENGFKK